jgi:hypothetical protein
LLDPGVYTLVYNSVDGAGRGVKMAALVTRTPQPPISNAEGFPEAVPDVIALDLVNSDRWTVPDGGGEYRLSYSGRGSASLSRE